MFNSRSLELEHADLIHDISYDYYGKRMATCSSDQIWDLQPNDVWKCSSQWRNHLGPVWRVAWAHPEFGQIIATCSFDRTVEIWEELSGKVKDGQLDSGTDTQINLHRNSVSEQLNFPSLNWVKRARFVDPRTSVIDIEFAPRHLGLQLACIDVGGFLRIYEAHDVMNLSQWTLQFDSRTGKPGSCLSWSLSRLDTPLIAIGSSDSEVGAAPSTTTQLVTHSVPASSSLGTLTIYECGPNNQWNRVENFHTIDRTVYDVAFAPHMGQSFQQLAIATSTDLVILRIKPCSKSGVYERSSFGIFKMASFKEHNGRVWRVSWNATGSVLASSGDDGCVRLWQTNYLGHWHAISCVQPSGASISDFMANDTATGFNSSLHKQSHVLAVGREQFLLKNLIPGLPEPPTQSIASSLWTGDSLSNKPLGTTS
ncbi:Nucleoporin SEH1 [Cichlidogyrus casuarinus]|uniref:Nucleoporin SEH1 n=1 Tax=Cichlidogyrus casuarinus TaxID=1844966 RepID=A0ABD2Q4Q5_9PLAT